VNDLRRLVVADYQQCVSLASVPDELKRSLKTNERVPVFIDNLVVQISRAKGVSRETIRTAVYDLTTTFLQLTHRKAEEMRMSDLARSTIEAKAREADAIEEATVEQASGSSD
jgi:hypothetical protein